MSKDNEERKLHYKMYKSGKLWIVAGLVSTTMAFGIIDNEQSANADTSTTTQVINQNGNVQTANPVKDDSQINNNSNSSSAISSSSTSSVASSSASSASSASSSSSLSSSSSSNSSAAVETINSDILKHLRNIDQNTYYYNTNGQPTKALLFEDNNQLYYFDDNGKLSDLPQNNIQTDVSTLTTDPNNAIYSNDGNSINNTNGFITANSWYRPKAVLKNGTTWTPSTSKDFRPILSVWWPSKTIQAKYVNYMNSFGFGNPSAVSYSNATTQDALNAAAKDIQASVEKKITTENGNTDWLKDLINNFIKSQPQWNYDSEVKTPQTFQGGTVKYVNNKLTSYANSDYRLLNRYPTNQTGTPDKTLQDLGGGGSEFLLANDIDNSNPAVQSEQLNWLYYLMNFGSITQNDPNANFDSYRVDAVDNVDSDLLQVASNYFKEAYGVNKNDATANAHIPILEDWSFSADPQYVNKNGANQLTMDFQFKAWEAASLMKPTDKRISLSNMIKTLVNRSNDTTNNKAIPNYSFIRAHDSEVQTIVQAIITAKIDPNSDGTTFTHDQLKRAFQIYDADEKSTNKQFTPYNIPLGYALLLTNKDTVPRVYYGDMYTDDGQYMANKSPYFDSITSMMKNRIKYVAGGQSMKINKVDGNEILSSVRYGKGVNKATQKKSHSKLARTSGLAVLMTNLPNGKFNKNSTVKVNMGRIHAKQKYQLIQQSTKNGIATNSNSKKTLTTNSKGILTVPTSYLIGVSNPQVSGALSIWAPVGANQNQDIRVAASTKKNTTKKTYHSNPALDSQVIFEGFSNFQAMPTKQSEYSNVVLAKQAPFFAKLGVTYFELPPQYRSSTDSSFIDSIIKNGYSFTDRYDLGFNNSDGTANPTKYGTADQLADALRAIHKSGMKAIADWVPDQVYNLPNEQVVASTRTDANGEQLVSSNMSDQTYYVNTLGSGDDYQAKYGGAFLNEMKKKYPNLFKTKMISNGKKLPTNEPIKKWEAKYLNGTNIQGHGTDFVISDTDKNGYFAVPSSDNTAITQSFLPQELLGNDVNYGFTKDSNNNVKYQTISGYQAQNAFYHSEDGNWYYFDQNGNMVTKPTTINGDNYYFLSNGINLRNITIFRNGKLYYYQGDGKQITTPGTYTINTVYPPLGSTDGSNVYTNIHVNADGSLATGLVKASPSEYQYFYDDGTQAFDQVIRFNNNKLMYFDSSDGNAVKNEFFQSNNNNWYHANKDGSLSVGLTKVDGQTLYFDANGVQVKGAVVKVGKKFIYLDPNSGSPVKNQLVSYNNNWYYAGKNTHLVTGLNKINGQMLYFDANGVQVKDPL
ncbi:glycoside hydrolase family 70 protein [Lactobacillaceae bacterium Scapto_B20]